MQQFRSVTNILLQVKHSTFCLSRFALILTSFAQVMSKQQQSVHFKSKSLNSVTLEESIENIKSIGDHLQGFRKHYGQLNTRMNRLKKSHKEKIAENADLKCQITYLIDKLNNQPAKDEEKVDYERMHLMTDVFKNTPKESHHEINLAWKLMADYHKQMMEAIVEAKGQVMQGANAAALVQSIEEKFDQVSLGIGAQIKHDSTTDTGKETGQYLQNTQFGTLQETCDVDEDM